MFTLILGDAASGKSALAEQLLSRSPGDPRIYLATLEVRDGESRARVARHRALRAGRGFHTLECSRGLRDLPVPGGCALLLEDLANLTANELYSAAAPEQDPEAAIVEGIRTLRARAETLVVVSCQVFSGGRDWLGDTLHYLEMLASLHRTLAREADCVVEAVCGQALCWKGENPWGS